MDLSIKKQDFLKVLQRVQGIVEKRNTMPILANVLIETSDDMINVTATDLEVFIKDSAPASVKKEGRITINARKIFEIVKELPKEDVNVSSGSNERITILSGRARFNIVGIPSDEFPVFPSFDESVLHLCEHDLLREMIDKTSFAVSTDETRYNINGFFLEREDSRLRMVATDGHRLAVIEKEVEDIPASQKGVILPRKGMMELRKILEEKEGEFYMGITEKSAIMKMDTTYINIRLFEGEFPDYRKVIPQENDKVLTADRLQLLSSLKRVSILSSEKIRGVKFSISTNRLNLSASSADIGDAEEEMDVEYTGDSLEIAFNARYLVDVLEVLKEERVRLELKDELSPGVVRAVDSDDYVYIIMPMRL